MKYSVPVGEQFYTKLSINNNGGQYNLKYHAKNHPKRKACEQWLDEFIISHKIKEFNKIAEAGVKNGFSYSLIRTLLNKKARIGELKKKKINNIVYYFID